MWYHARYTCSAVHSHLTSIWHHRLSLLMAWLCPAQSISIHRKRRHRWSKMRLAAVGDNRIRRHLIWCGRPAEHLSTAPVSEISSHDAKMAGGGHNNKTMAMKWLLLMHTLLPETQRRLDKIDRSITKSSKHYGDVHSRKSIHNQDTIAPQLHYIYNYVMFFHSSQILLESDAQLKKAFLKWISFVSADLRYKLWLKL